MERCHALLLALEAVDLFVSESENEIKSDEIKRFETKFRWYIILDGDESLRKSSILDGMSSISGTNKRGDSF